MFVLCGWFHDNNNHSRCLCNHPVNLVRLDGKWLDGVALIPWQGSKSLTSQWSALLLIHICMPRPTLPAALLKLLQLGRSRYTLPFLLTIFSANSFWDLRSIEHIWSQLPVLDQSSLMNIRTPSCQWYLFVASCFDPSDLCYLGHKKLIIAIKIIIILISMEMCLWRVC